MEVQLRMSLFLSGLVHASLFGAVTRDAIQRGGKEGSAIPDEVVEQLALVEKTITDHLAALNRAQIDALMGTLDAWAETLAAETADDHVVVIDVREIKPDK